MGNPNNNFSGKKVETKAEDVEALSFKEFKIIKFIQEKQGDFDTVVIIFNGNETQIPVKKDSVQIDSTKVKINIQNIDGKDCIVL